jgi:hypothetical protein
MRDIDTLVAELSSDVANKRAWQRAPAALAGKLLAVLFIYGAAVQVHLGLRADLRLQFARPLFDLEILLLAALALSSVIAATIAMYPDAYQKPGWLKLPYAVAALLAVLMIVQLAMPTDARMVMAAPGMIAMHCAMCIGWVAMLPSLLLFVILRRGATVRPLQAGIFAVLAASAIGCLTLRLSEANDSLAHLLLWHYLPTLVFATLGAVIGSRVLKW